MELCDLNLDEYNKANWKLASVLNHNDTCVELNLWNIMRQITAGLAFIHSYNEVHRDIKPSNSIFPCSNAVNTQSFFLVKTKPGSWPILA
jgi:serine/threonine protein kinase